MQIKLNDKNAPGGSTAFDENADIGILGPYNFPILRRCFDAINANFTELYGLVGRAIPSSNATAFNSNIPLNGNFVMPAQAITAVLSFTPGAGAVNGGSCIVELTADGDESHIPDFSAFDYGVSSVISDYANNGVVGSTAPGTWVNTAGAVNRVRFVSYIASVPHGALSGGQLSPAAQALSNFTTVTNGGMTITIDGTVHNLTGINLSAVSGLDGVAAAVQTALAASATVSWNAQYSQFSVTSASTGNSSTISYALAPESGTDLSPLMGLDPGHAVSDVSDIMYQFNIWQGAGVDPLSLPAAAPSVASVSLTHGVNPVLTIGIGGSGLNPLYVPLISVFSVSGSDGVQLGNGLPEPINGPPSSSNKIVVTSSSIQVPLNGTVAAGDVVTFSYTPPADGALQDTNGVRMGAITAASVTAS